MLIKSQIKLAIKFFFGRPLVLFDVLAFFQLSYIRSGLSGNIKVKFNGQHTFARIEERRFLSELKFYQFKLLWC